jgi:hypothetical protein
MIILIRNKNTVPNTRYKLLPGKWFFGFGGSHQRILHLW